MKRTPERRVSRLTTRTRRRRDCDEERRTPRCCEALDWKEGKFRVPVVSMLIVRYAGVPSEGRGDRGDRRHLRGGRQRAPREESGQGLRALVCSGIKSSDRKRNRGQLRRTDASAPTHAHERWVRYHTCTRRRARAAQVRAPGSTHSTQTPRTAACAAPRTPEHRLQQAGRRWAPEERIARAPPARRARLAPAS